MAKYKKGIWSVSRVKLWLESPWDFYCKYVKGIDRASPFQDALDRGTVLHGILELLSYKKYCMDTAVDEIIYNNNILKQYNHLMEDGKRIPKSMKKAIVDIDNSYKEKINHKELIKVLSDKGIEDGVRVAKKYIEHYGSVHNMGKVIATEMLIEWDMNEYLPNQSFIGYIDKVVEDNRGNIWLVDHKTYSNKPKYNDLRLELQANVYMWVMKNVYGVEVDGFIYDCINPKEKIVGKGYHFYQAKISYNERIINMVMENFLTTIEIILKHPEYTMYKPSPYGTPYMTELLHGFDGGYIKINGVEEDEE